MKYPRKSKQWHEDRRNGIGGADTMFIMETAPVDWGDIGTCWEIKTGRREPAEPNYPMMRGLRLEPFARQAYEEINGILMPATFKKHPSIDFARANLDGLNKELNKGLEIKCPGKADHAIAKAGKIPDKYLYQCVHNCMVADLDSLDYFSFYDYGQTDVATVTYERDLKLEKKLLAKEYPFWECVVKDIRPGTFTKEKKVKIPPKAPYTKAEVVEILQVAAGLGATLVRLPGYEFAFELNKEAESEEDSAEDGANSGQDQECDVCGSELIEGEFSMYCKPCYIRKKEKEKSRSFDNGPFRIKRKR